MTETFSNLNLEEPREINLDEIEANLEKARQEKEMGVVAEELIQESADTLHQRQMQEGLNEQQAIADMRQKERDHEEAIAEDARFTKEKIDALHAEALDDDLAFEQKQFAHSEAIAEDANRTEQNIFAEKQATAFAGKEFYTLDPERIRRQEEIVEWAKEYHPAGLEEEEERLAKMRASTRNIDASRFVSRYWGGTLEDHKDAVKAFSGAISSAQNTDELLNTIAEWGGIPLEDGKFITNDKLRQFIFEVLKVQDESERTAQLEKLVKNKEVSDKFNELQKKDKQHLYESLDATREETYDTDSAISTVHSKLFQFSPTLYGMFSKKNRQNLAELRKLGIPFDTDIERRSAAHIGLGFKLQNLRNEKNQIQGIIKNRGMDIDQPKMKNQVYVANGRMVKVENPKPILGGPGSEKKKSFLSRLLSF